MGGKSCFFIGHRETSEAIYPALYAVVEQHILEYGVTEFIVGHYGGFDRLAASAAKEYTLSRHDAFRLGKECKIGRASCRERV